MDSTTPLKLWITQFRDNSIQSVNARYKNN